MAKEGNNTRILDIRGRGVPFYSTSIKLYYKSVNSRYNNPTNDLTNNFTSENRANTKLDAIPNNKLKRNPLRKRGRPKKLNQFIVNLKNFLQSNEEQFTELRKKELLSLIEKGVF
jgi:hypothetical protein